MSAHRSLRIVVADDNFDSLATLKAILQDEGHEVLGVANGRSALEAVRHFDPDAVILDIAMPDLSGWEVAREIRDASGRSDRPLLIAISGHSIVTYALLSQLFPPHTTPHARLRRSITKPPLMPCANGTSTS